MIKFIDIPQEDKMRLFWIFLQGNPADTAHKLAAIPGIENLGIEYYKTEIKAMYNAEDRPAPCILPYSSCMYKKNEKCISHRKSNRMASACNSIHKEKREKMLKAAKEKSKG